MNETVCPLTGILGSGLCLLFGGWDAAMMALTVCMSIDYITGTLVALVFHNSNKSESGCYNSAYGLKGLCKKCLMLLFVIVAVQADRLMGGDLVRDAVCIGFCVNEILSIVENLGLAGVPMPQAVVDTLEQLQNR